MRKLCLLGLGVVLALVACRKQRRAATLPTGNGQTIDENLGIDDLRRDLESTVLEYYVQLSFGNVEAAMEGFAEGRDLHMVGVTPDDVVTGRDPEALRRDRRLYQERGGVRILSKNLDVALSADGAVGWVFDELSYRVEYMGREASIPIRSTAVYIRDVQRWRLMAEHQSYSIPSSDLVLKATRGELERGVEFDNHYGNSKSEASALAALVGRVLNGSESMQGVDQAILLLPGLENEFHGLAAQDAPSLAELFSSDTTVAVRRYRVQVAPNKNTAWMLADLRARVPHNGETVLIPLRGSFVFQRLRQGGPWGVVQAHVSAGLMQRQLSEQIFGPISEDL